MCELHRVNDEEQARVHPRGCYRTQRCKRDSDGCKRESQPRVFLSRFVNSYSRKTLITLSLCLSLSNYPANYFLLFLSNCHTPHALTTLHVHGLTWTKRGVCASTPSWRAPPYVSVAAAHRKTQIAN